VIRRFIGGRVLPLLVGLVSGFPLCCIREFYKLPEKRARDPEHVGYVRCAKCIASSRRVPIYDDLKDGWAWGGPFAQIYDTRREANLNAPRELWQSPWWAKYRVATSKDGRLSIYDFPEARHP
jgi:hypothetical protein